MECTIFFSLIIRIFVLESNKYKWKLHCWMHSHGKEMRSVSSLCVTCWIQGVMNLRCYATGEMQRGLY